MPNYGYSSRAESGVHPLTFIAFATFWCSFVLAFDGLLLFTAVRNQLASQRYRQTSGTVTTSQLGSRPGAKIGSVYGPQITYEYTVKGVQYHGSRWDFNGVMSSDSDWARDIVSSHPVGSAVTVYFDPFDPAQSVLSLDSEPAVAFVLLFMIPFNTIAASFVLIGIKALITRRSVPFGVRVIGDCTAGVIIRDNMNSPLTVAGAVLFLGSFLATVVLCFSVGPHPSQSLAVTTLLAVVAVAVVAALITRWRFDPERTDLVLDYTTGLLRTPALNDRPQRAQIPLSSILEFMVTTNEGDKFSVHAVLGESQEQTKLVHILPCTGANPQRFAAYLTSLLRDAP